MFNKIVLLAQPARTEYVTRTVHEHRAPTDESVKILREMEQAARADILASRNLKNNVFEGTLELHEDHRERRRFIRVVAKLNGRNVEFVEPVDMGSRLLDENIDALFNAVVKGLAAKMVDAGVRNLIRDGMISIQGRG